MLNLGLTLLACTRLAHAACPYMEHDVRGESPHHAAVRRDNADRPQSTSTDDFMAQFEVDDTDVYLTNNFGGPIEDQESLSAGERGPTLLEDFIFREKMMHFGMIVVPCVKTVH
jgi:catalase